MKFRFFPEKFVFPNFPFGGAGGEFFVAAPHKSYLISPVNGFTGSFIGGTYARTYVLPSPKNIVARGYIET